MKLTELIKGLKLNRITGDTGVEITGITYNSRNVMPGTLFVAIKGLKTDGHNFITDAVKAGATALIVENNPVDISPPLSMPVIEVTDSRMALAQVAINYYRNPAKEIKLIGVTGTNGKTTTTYLIRSILEGCNDKVGVIGTVSYYNGNKTSPAEHTTPEAVEFQGLLRSMVDNGCKFVVTEVSSHALMLKRVLGTEFETAVFTNLTQDHLDFHTDMEDYFQAKALLFRNMSSQKKVIINIDDPYGKRLMGMTKGIVLSYGINSDADIQGRDVSLKMDGIEFRVRTPAGDIHIKSGLVGIYNVYNILASIGVALSQDIPPDKISAGISSLISVPGRFEKIDSGMGFGIVVDYAHTENALRLLLEAAQGFTKRRIITLFGCGGDRDRGKRPLMGKAAMELSDYVIVTSDNPRTENAEKIIEGVLTGIKDAMKSGKIRASGYKVIPDRKTAIEEAINMAQEGDLVVIAGKGHECYQIIGNEKFQFDDREEARKAIMRRRNKLS